MCRSIISMVFSHVVLLDFFFVFILQILMFFTNEINIAVSRFSILAIVCWCLISSTCRRVGWLTKYAKNIIPEMCCLMSIIEQGLLQYVVVMMEFSFWSYSV